jgi:hypothetical protein
MLDSVKYFATTSDHPSNVELIIFRGKSKSLDVTHPEREPTLSAEIRYKGLFVSGATKQPLIY